MKKFNLIEAVAFGKLESGAVRVINSLLTSEVSTLKQKRIIKLQKAKRR